MLAVAAGLLLRLWWILHLGQITVDTRNYGMFARNLLEHGVYGFDNLRNGILLAPVPTLIRLPGYPLFLAACFRLFGMENYTAVMLVQAAFDLWTCVLVAGIARRLFHLRTALATLWLAALCPFTANYVAVPLTETLTLFCIALAFYALLRWRDSGRRVDRWLLALAFALAYAILLRPEQGLLAAAVVPAVFALAFRQEGFRALGPTLIVSVLTLLPLVPWAARNWRTFHVFQPLAPRFATDPGALINYGFQRWFRTWAIDFASNETCYWSYDGQDIRIADLPDRAFDTQAQYAATDALLKDYNQTDQPTKSLDDRFNAIAEQRIHSDPLRYFVALPVARVLDMAFRPRTEMMPVPNEWWKFRRPHRFACCFALAYAVLNLGFFILAGMTAFRRGLWRHQQVIVWSMLATIVLRTLLLLTIDNSEPRYTLEFFPVFFVLAGATLSRFTYKASL